MSWIVQRISRSPLQTTVTIANTDPAATVTTDYHAADKLARDTLGATTLHARGYSLSGAPIRVYASQAY